MEHFEKAFSLYDPERHRDDAFFYSQNPGVIMGCHAAWALWFLGQPDQALNRIKEALTLARELTEPHGLAHALFFAAILHQLRREEPMAQEYAEAVISFSREHGLVMYQAMATIVQAWALLKQGRTEQTVEQMRQGLAALQTTGTERVRPHFLALLAEAMDTDRRAEEGLRLLEEAQAIIDRNSERYYQAELYRLQGELLLKQSKGRCIPQMLTGGTAVVEAESPAVTDAEGCFNESIKIAQRQKAKSLELRAAISMARLYQNQGRLKEARSLLAQIYDNFTEGFDTMDLREAKVLLNELS
jgi:predicted ATPase